MDDARPASNGATAMRLTADYLWRSNIAQHSLAAYLSIERRLQTATPRSPVTPRTWRHDMPTPACFSLAVRGSRTSSRWRTGTHAGAPHGLGRVCWQRVSNSASLSLYRSSALLRRACASGLSLATAAKTSTFHAFAGLHCCAHTRVAPPAADGTARDNTSDSAGILDRRALRFGCA